MRPDAERIGSHLVAALAGGTLCLALAVASAWAQGGSATAEPARSTPDTAPAEEEARYQVLLLYSESRLTRSVVSADEAFRATFEERSPRRVHFYTEFLDLNAANAALLQRELLRVLGFKYRDRHVDLIVAQGQLTVPFALEARDELFPGVPLVLMCVERSTFARLPASADVTGTWRQRGWRDTLELARRLHPDMRRAVVIVGSSVAERLWLHSAREQLSDVPPSVEVRYLSGDRLEDIPTAVAGLPRDAVVLVGPFLRDGTGRDFSTPAAVRRIAAASSVPVYGLTEGVVGTGVIGGHVLSFEAHGRLAAELALKRLAGERPAPTAAGTTVAMFDHRQLGRWGVDQRLLPAGSEVLFREPSLWERYRTYAVVAAALILVQSGLIAVLLVQRAQRRRAQRDLAERLRFETLLSDISQALAACPAAEIDREIGAGLRRVVEHLDTDRATLWALDDQAGEARVTHSWTRPGVDPVMRVVEESQLPWLFDQIRRGAVVRLPATDGAPVEQAADRETLRGIRVRSAAIAPLVEGGVVTGGLSVGTVVEERRWLDTLVPRLRLLADVFANGLARQRADQSARESARDIRDLAGRLMTAEEDERRRIARELHDGVNQDLAALSIALSALQDGLPADLAGGRREELARLQDATVELAGAIRHLSHELHPGILRYAGLGPAVRSYCREFQREGAIAVLCSAKDDLETIPPDVALCLYRVMQEALRNAARHAKADHVWVSLERRGADVSLTVRDDGRGFDLAQARRGGGLGLMSLDERVRLVGGRLTIDAEPERGTAIHVMVPLA